jgi:HAD superfamily hydrolase (TIGR01549 family)
MMSPTSRQFTTSHHRYALVIFDMDGTLTEELLDFAAIRAEMGLPEKAPILESMAALPAKERSRAEEVLHRHEMQAAAECKLHDGAAEVLSELKARGVATALLTRNSTACATSVLTRHKLELDVVATREHTPHKPHADSILNIVRRLRILPEQTLMVGDFLYDVQAARNAGVDSALFCKPGPLPEYAGLATFTIRQLREVLELVDRPRVGPS